MEASSCAFVVNIGEVVMVVDGGGEEERETGERETGGGKRGAERKRVRGEVTFSQHQRGI
jgi:hypothetical protein